MPRPLGNCHYICTYMRVVNGSRDLRARSIKPFAGGRPRLRRTREVSVTLYYGFSIMYRAVDKLWEKHTAAAARSCCITSRRIARGRPPPGGYVVCWACSVTWRCESSARPDRGKG